MSPANLSSASTMMNVRVLGSGAQVVALAHGFGCTQSVWDTVLPSLLANGELQIVVWDWPGSAASPDAFLPLMEQATTTISRKDSRPSNGDDDDDDDDDLGRIGGNDDDERGGARTGGFFHAFAHLLVRLLDELRIESCIFVGHSMSAMVGCLAALEHPHRFSKLVLLNASPRYIRDGDYYGGFEREEVEQMMEAMGRDFGGWAARFARAAVGDGAGPAAAADRFRATLAAMRADVALAMARDIFGSDFRADVARATSSARRRHVVHLIQSAHDVVVPLAVTDFLRRLLVADHHPGNISNNSSSSSASDTVQVLETSGHLPHLTCSHLFTPALLKILLP